MTHKLATLLCRRSVGLSVEPGGSRVLASGGCESLSTFLPEINGPTPTTQAFRAPDRSKIHLAFRVTLVLSLAPFRE
jgi:hypothetical protein